MSQNVTVLSRVSPLQRKAIEGLLSQPSVTAAAEAAGCARASIHRWLREDETFKAALAQAEALALAAASRRLIAGQDKAMDTLEYLMDKAESESVRKAAASDWMGYSMKLREWAIEERLNRLEEAMLENSN